MGFALKSIDTFHFDTLLLFFVYQGLSIMPIHIAECKKGPPKNPINQKFKGTGFNLISQRRILHVPHWSMSEFRGLRDWGAGLLHLDGDSYWSTLVLGGRTRACVQIMKVTRAVIPDSVLWCLVLQKKLEETK